MKVVNEGEAIVRMKALTDEESDAMEMSFPVYVHGMLKMESFAGVDPARQGQRQGHDQRARPSGASTQSRLEVRYSPTLAGAMVDALPYLVDYPYGCTEQTLNRFLPTVITQKIAACEMKLDLKDDPGEADQPQRPGDRRRPRAGQAVEAVRPQPGLRRGRSRPHGQGRRQGPHRTCSSPTAAGAGSPAGASTAGRTPPRSSSTACRSPRQNDVALVPGVLERGVDWLKSYQAEQVQLTQERRRRKIEPWKKHADNLDALVYMVLVDADVDNDEMRDFLYRDRTKLAVYAKAMFGLALHKQQRARRSWR